jgi:CubicO group peptidase (beta-lactamase class C family)
VIALLAGLEERARSFHFDEEARPAVTSRADVPAALKDLVDRAARAAKWRGCAAIAYGEGPAAIACASGDEPPFDGRTRFSIGSLWKQFLGFRVQELAKEGRLSLDDRADVRLPELAGTPAGRPRVRDLLHMTSGLPYVIPLGTNLATQLSSVQRSDADFLRVAAASPLSFEPGAAYQYSNVGYGLLAILIGRAEGRPWRDAMRALFARAGMTDTGFFTGVEPSPPVVRGYLPVRCGVVFGGPCLLGLPRWNYSMLVGGGVYSTMEDMLRWFAMLRRVEREDPLQWGAFTEAVNGYASGWGIEPRTMANGERISVASHSAEDPGYFANFLRVPAREVTAVFLSSSDFMADGGFPIFEEMTGLALGEGYRTMR